MTRPRLGKFFPRARAADLYAQGLSLRQMGERLGYTVSAVRNQLVKAGVPLRGRGGPRAMAGIAHPNYRKTRSRTP